MSIVVGKTRSVPAVRSEDQHGAIDIRSVRTRLFDKSTDHEARLPLRDSLRIEVDRPVTSDPVFRAIVHSGAGFPHGLSTLPRDTIVAMLMYEGFALGRKAFSLLQSMYGSVQFVMADYYKANDPNAPTFADGSRMSGKVYISVLDMSILMKGRKPILLVDDRRDGGARVVAIGNAFRAHGVAGDMYTLHAAAAEGHEATETEPERIVKRWDGLVTKGRGSLRSTDFPEMVTEYGNSLSGARRG